MISNIDFPEIKEVAVAIIPEKNEEAPDNPNWYVYIINIGKTEITNLMVTSKGFGKLNGEDVKTSTLRRFLDDLDGDSFLQIEPIQEEVFGINNEFWISFYREGKLYDKKYLFTAGSISNTFLVEIPVMNVKGICHP